MTVISLQPSLVYVKHLVSPNCAIGCDLQSVAITDAAIGWLARSHCSCVGCSMSLKPDDENKHSGNPCLLAARAAKCDRFQSGCNQEIHRTSGRHMKTRAHPLFFVFRFAYQKFTKMRLVGKSPYSIQWRNQVPVVL